MITESLKVLVTVVDNNSFSRAAEELFLSQPSVSFHIRNLEDEFGAKLLNRSSRRLSLTPAGKALFKHAKKILDHYDQAKNEIDELRQVVTGTLRIGASFTIGEYVLPRFLAEVSVNYPNVNVSVSIANTEEIAQMLRQNHLDIGIVEGQVTLPNIEEEPFMQDDMLLIVPLDHPLSKLKKVSADDLQNQIWILRESGSGTRSFGDDLLKSLDIKVNRSFVFSSNEGIKEAVIHGLGIAFVSRLVVHKELAAKIIKTVPIKTEEKLQLSRRLSILHSKEQTSSKAVDEFLEKLRLFKL
ncbi:transcriptional regulator [Desulfosporosinus acidiphilus SJ4]|uniref:Transcriptional regulator n=1 Tax=Desulfosporosinus acidiphilus (strain DSM 22704 / JCM 16185 / SJ4) TaxID=646529 RepID=I4D503_DESAJ|nr:LysR substrate-binding domain-containing protein [Desulfosporosinus acidiphilus]AFM40877.1 transcriptional regulator [Desulfosporosinus acidiphilus SJ4]